MKDAAADRLRAMVEKYGSRVLGRCRAFVADRSTADDLAQEVFSRLCDVVNDPRRRREDIPRSLIEGIMKNVFLEHLHDRKRAPRPLSPDREIGSSADHPAYQVEQEDQDQAVRSLVEKLESNEQEVILGRHFLGMNLTELCELLNVPRTTIIRRYNRAMIRLGQMAVDRGLLP